MEGESKKHGSQDRAFEIVQTADDDRRQREKQPGTQQFDAGQNLIDDAASIGKPRGDAEIRIVDENDVELPAGEIGELVFRPADPWRVMLGYDQIAEATISNNRNSGSTPATEHGRPRTAGSGMSIASRTASGGVERTFPRRNWMPSSGSTRISTMWRQLRFLRSFPRTRS
ncbi:AMP-binding protein [Rhodomicrobium vannielii]|uniref:AMP-binding protein n=1 Tax=Rhodomicrobium vannielii TaxID=1069 RepID=UPI0012DC6F78|nr:AMP-binding protein [Rhodomicrobium vannielii]